MKHCEYCEAELSAEKTHLRFCNRSCAGKYSVEARKKTNLEKYGSENVFSSPIIKDQIKKTNLEKYGVENTFQRADIIEKCKKTNLARYGTEIANQSEIVKDRMKAAWAGYNGGHPWSDPMVRQKREQTLISKFGVAHPILSDEINEKNTQYQY